MAKLVLELGEECMASAVGMRELILKKVIEPTSEHGSAVIQRWLAGPRVHVTAEEAPETELEDETPGELGPAGD